VSMECVDGERRVTDGPPSHSLAAQTGHSYFWWYANGLSNGLFNGLSNISYVLSTRLSNISYGPSNVLSSLEPERRTYP